VYRVEFWFEISTASLHTVRCFGSLWRRTTLVVSGLSN